MRLLGSPERGVVAIAVVAGCLLRWWHLGTPSLWWDEMVQIGMASAGSVWEVVERVRRGIPPGAGNAGAVPLDYVVTHLWLRFVPFPERPELIETYYRLPSFVFSCLTVFALAWYARRFFGERVAALAAVLLALSLPHVLYAAEARFYSLLLLTGVLHLATFTALVGGPATPARWALFTVASVAYVLTGLFSLLLLVWEYAALVALQATRGIPGTRRRPLAAAGVSAAVLLASMALWYADTALSTQSVRGTAHVSGLRIARETLYFFTTHDPLATLAIVVALVAVPLEMLRRRHPLWPVTAALAAGSIATPFVIAALMTWKQHYYHPRHGLLLLPGLLLLLAIGLSACGDVLARPPLRGRWRRAVALGVPLALVLAWQAPLAARYVATPWGLFARTKILRDFKTLAHDLRAQVADFEPRDRLLLIVGRVHHGTLGNPLLGKYLEWYGLTDRVLLRGVPRPSPALQEIRQICPGGSCARYGSMIQHALELQPPFEISPPKRRLVGLPRAIGRWPGRPREVAVLVYTPIRRERADGSLRGWRGSPYVGFVVFTPVGAPPFAPALTGEVAGR